MTRIYCILLISLTSIPCFSQVSDIFRVEYTYFPQRDSKNSFKRFRTFANIPIKVDDKGSYLVPGIEYRNVNFDFEDSPPFNVEKLDNFHSFNLTIGYTFKMKNDWRFAARTGALLASNFEGDGIEDKDILYSGAIYMIKDKTDDDSVGKPWRLIVGMQYSTVAGRPFPLPIVNYFRRFHPDWSYTLGIPKSNIKYFINKKNILQSFVTLDGFFANIQNDRIVPSNTGGNPAIAENISMTIALAGLGYEYQFSRHVVFYIYGGRTLLNDIRLRDKNGDDVFTINDVNTIYFRSGIKLKI